MAALSQNGIPGVGFGILHPKLNNRFVVLFTDKDGVDLPFADALSRQITSVGDIRQIKAVECSSTKLVFDDDILNQLCDSLQKLWELDEFDIHIKYLDGNEHAVRTHTLKSAKVFIIEHAELDYAGGAASRIYSKSEVAIAKTEGNFVNKLFEHPIAAALLHIAQNLRFSKVDYNEKSRSILQKTVTISYKQLIIH